MELWDLYDVDRLPTGATVERRSGLPEGQLHVVVHVCVFDGAGQLLIQRRTDTRPNWPGLWDFSVGGSVHAGESSREGAVREVREELGLNVDLARPSFTFNFQYGFDDFYLLRIDADLPRLAVPNEEVAEVRWAYLDEVLELVRSGRFINYRESVVRFVFDFLDQRNIFDHRRDI
ncbi:NUDIX hydrolase [Corynebacterium comes]|uniref:Isopentenyl-diphosphate Delta-isomerase n=1 Tax=Corynebacterium comes TaxID=2675218 RepID=A0A6B8VZI2_9CORY|nr:NUDIX domain-containing protein [Corynebacterium comes]QGU04465.1 Isopentenyl-diphosphate Delta-isomerase [Corynebacterium comes]